MADYYVVGTQDKLTSQRYADYLKNAVASGGRTGVSEYGSRNAGRIEDYPVSTEETVYEYAGYFKIFDATDTVTEGDTTTIVNKIIVKDGSPLERPTQPCYVNGVVTSLPSWTSSTLEKDKTYYVRCHYTAATPASGTVGTDNYVASVPATLVIEASLTRTPSDSAMNVYWDIGMVVIDGEGNVTIQQDWISGIIRMFWYGECY